MLASSAGEGPVAASEEAREQPTRHRPVTASRQRAHLDPETGTLMVPPAKLRTIQLSPELEQALSASHEGLVEVALPDGTVVLNLQGRFTSMLFATLGQDGETETRHAPALLPGPREEKGDASTAEQERR